jgi:DAK2 domain fusion protein YloV
MQSLDSAGARRWAVSALAALGEAREEIDALNVFPVPDGDTGTNMYLTLEAAVTAAETVPDGASVSRLAETFARGALLGARGNSGVIGAQLLRGWADTLSEFTQLSAASAVEGFRRADEQAWRAVNDPVEGTILSVSRAAARAAAGAKPTLEAVVTAAADAAQVALDLTPSQLPVLARAGVVDAGGRGLVVLIDSLAELVLGSSRRRPGRGYRHPALPAVDFSSCADLTSGGPTYEVMFLLDTSARPDDRGPDDGMDRLRPLLAKLGDSLVVVGGPGLWQVHVHVHDAGAAIEAALDFGRPHRIRVEHFSDHGVHRQRRLSAGNGPRLTDAGQTGALLLDEIAAAGEKTRRPTGIGLVACAAGPGLAELFEAAGAVVVGGGPGRRPSTAQLLDAIRRTTAAGVALLPNDGDTMNVAQVAASAARAEGIRVTVLPTRAQVQGLAAAAVHDPARSFDDDVVSMSAAAGGARDGAVTVAVKDGLTSAGECRKGDALGVVDGDFAVVGSDLVAVAIEVVERLLSGGGELVTLVVGVGEHESLARAVAVHLRTRHRQVEVSVLNGGQPRYPLLIGVE